MNEEMESDTNATYDEVIIPTRIPAETHPVRPGPYINCEDQRMKLTYIKLWLVVEWSLTSVPQPDLWMTVPIEPRSSVCALLTY